jgi:plasmid maintenance system antidote protein VapI
VIGARRYRLKWRCASSAFGVSMDTLMHMQNSYDIAQARRRAGHIKVARFRKVGDPTLS